MPPLGLTVAVGRRTRRAITRLPAASKFNIFELRRSARVILCFVLAVEFAAFFGLGIWHITYATGLIGALGSALWLSAGVAGLVAFIGQVN
jgi:hypothetical protein